MGILLRRCERNMASNLLPQNIINLLLFSFFFCLLNCMLSGHLGFIFNVYLSS